jgi:hypothetical protein
MSRELIVAIVGAVIAGIFLLVSTMLGRNSPTNSSTTIVNDNGTLIESVENLIINQ